MTFIQTMIVRCKFVTIVLKNKTCGIYFLHSFLRPSIIIQVFPVCKDSVQLIVRILTVALSRYERARAKKQRAETAAN